MAAATALILATDAERMLRRVAEGSVTPRIQISIWRGLNEEMNAYFVEAVHDYLQTRAIRIEPEEWSGSPVSIVRV